jgi:hypothetical protein
VANGKLPSCWSYGSIASQDPSIIYFLIAIPEFLNDPAFYEELVDGNPSAKMIWQQYRLQIAKESA